MMMKKTGLALVVGMLLSFQTSNGFTPQTGFYAGKVWSALLVGMTSYDICRLQEYMKQVEQVENEPEYMYKEHNLQVTRSNRNVMALASVMGIALSVHQFSLYHYRGLWTVPFKVVTAVNALALLGLAAQQAKKEYDLRNV